MIVNSGINRFQSGWTNPGNVWGGSIALSNDVGVNSTAYQNKGYASAEMGLGSVLSDITSGNFSNLPSSVVSGLGNGDIGAWAIVGGLAFLVLPLLFKGGKSAARQVSRRAALKGAIARQQELLKGA